MEVALGGWKSTMKKREKANSERKIEKKRRNKERKTQGRNKKRKEKKPTKKKESLFLHYWVCGNQFLGRSRLKGKRQKDRKKALQEKFVCFHLIGLYVLFGC